MLFVGYLPSQVLTSLYTACLPACAFTRLPPPCRVRWYVSSLGSEDSLHTAHWHGISFNMNGQHMDQVRGAGGRDHGM